MVIVELSLLAADSIGLCSSYHLRCTNFLQHSHRGPPLVAILQDGFGVVCPEVLFSGADRSAVHRYSQATVSLRTGGGGGGKNR